MDKSDCLYTSYLNILKEELVPAMGCTEPICLAYAAAKAHEILGTMPKRVEIQASGNIIKNVKSVIVPNTKGMKGLKASVAAGIVAGNPEKALEVIAEVTPEQKKEIAEFLDEIPMTIIPLNIIAQLDVTVTLYNEEHFSSVRIAGFHTNIVKMEKDNEVLFDSGYAESGATKLTDRRCLSMKGIFDFANTVDIEDLKPIIQPQIECNKAISQEGLKNNWGANVGIARRGLYHFSIETRPWWDAQAHSYQQQIVKTIVPVYGEDWGWHLPSGLSFEIVPLVRPFGLTAPQ